MSNTDFIPDTIAAISTPPGVGGIAVVRLSGPRAIEIAASAWHGKDLCDAISHSAHLGKYFLTDGTMLDECVATIFRNPASFTGEDVVEISVHGSRWIQRQLVSDLVRRGARVAAPGEFTRRAFMNGKIDLTQAEGVADLIASSSKAAHAMAVSQTRGKFSRELDSLRERLTEFASLLELELDFSEEDVEFADREKLSQLAMSILCKLDNLAHSYSTGSVLKDGVPVVIAGIPNAGKSSVLNLLLNDDKAIVTDIPGTTRDFIEDTVEIDGVMYRLTDTAGLHDTDDTVESIGISRTRDKMKKAAIVIWVIDPTVDDTCQFRELESFITQNPDAKLIVLINKSDISDLTASSTHTIYTDKTLSDGSKDMTISLQNAGREINCIRFSTVTKAGLDELHKKLGEISLEGNDLTQDIIVTNARHYEAIIHGAASLRRAIEGIEASLSADFIAQDVRETLHHLSTITGTITTDTLLHSIFSRFCIGK